MRTITLELEHIETVAALHIYLQYMLRFPAHYGRNLDALHDALGEIAQPTRLIVRAQGVKGETAAVLPRLLCVLEDAQQENLCLHVERA